MSFRALAPLALLLASCACPSVRIADATFCVEVAETEAERVAGLRGREEPLGPGVGLLLPFPVEDEICIVNDGVLFAIDVAYASADGLVVAVERGVPAGDPTPRCHAGTRDVLEVASGELATVGVGDRFER